MTGDLSETLSTNFVRSTLSDPAQPAATPASGKEVDEFMIHYEGVQWVAENVPQAGDVGG